MQKVVFVSSLGILQAHRIFNQHGYTSNGGTNIVTFLSTGLVKQDSVQSSSHQLECTYLDQYTENVTNWHNSGRNEILLDMK